MRRVHIRTPTLLAVLAVTAFAAVTPAVTVNAAAVAAAADRRGGVAGSVVEIVGIESDTPEPWWAKRADEVVREAARRAATDDPLLGFFCVRDGGRSVQAALREAADPAQLCAVRGG